MPRWSSRRAAGIEPVPERLQVLGLLDGFLLWANLSVSLLVIVAGAFLVLPVGGSASGSRCPRPSPRSPRRRSSGT